MKKKEFNSLAEFKKLIQKDVLVGGIFHKYFENGKGFSERKMEDRPVNIVQTNAFTLKTKKTSGETVDSWFHFPKASQIKIVDKTRLEIYETEVRTGKTELILTYWIYEN
jgi:hypothetical protein